MEESRSLQNTVKKVEIFVSWLRGIIRHLPKIPNLLNVKKLDQYFNPQLGFLYLFSGAPRGPVPNAGKQLHCIDFNVGFKVSTCIYA